MIFVLFLSVSTFAQDGQQRRDAEAIRAVIESAKILAASDLSCTSASDCEVIAIGSRACGGPSGYLVTSKNNQNLNEIETLAQRSENLQQEYNRNYRMISICSILARPMPKCVAERCN